MCVIFYRYYKNGIAYRNSSNTRDSFDHEALYLTHKLLFSSFH